MELIRVENLSKIFNLGQPDEQTAVKDVSLSVERGEVLALTGPSGSGKSTLLSLLGCMARPSQGKIIVAGEDVVKLPERFLTEVRREKFGFIFQQFNLLRDLTAIDNVMLPLYPLKTALASMKEQAGTILENLQISKKKHQKVKKLSGGEQQRVAIARALINEPEVLIADEPTAHLDRKLASEFMEILAGLHADGKTIIIASHDPFVYENPLIDRTIHLRDGQLERSST